MLRGTTAVLTLGSLGLVVGAGRASALAHPTLRMGSRGTAVRALQIRLTALGYWLGAVDGQYGDLTRQAVVTLQKVAGLARDGICGPDDGVVPWIFNTSTGSGRKYRSGGKEHVAVTPSGDFRVFRRVDGWDDGPLGKLYRPQYFNGGIAVHGYPSVPPTPASHGCCRVSLPAMDFLWGAGGMKVGTRVLVR